MSALENRLRQTYRQAQSEAQRRLQRARRRLEAFSVENIDGFGQVVPVQYRQLAAKQYLMRVESETGLVSGIANSLQRAGRESGAAIQATTQGMYARAYRSGVREIQGIINTHTTLYRENALNALFNGETSPLGGFEGFSSRFTQVQQRQLYGRRLAKHYFERAVSTLGSNPAIVTKLQNALAQGLVLGEGIPQIATRINRVIESSRMQAVRIARTETMRAVNGGKMLGYMQIEQETGLPLIKQWIATSDTENPPRPDHEDAKGQKRPLNEPFDVGGELMMYPHDPNGSAGQTINCRCTMSVSVGQKFTTEQERELEERFERGERYTETELAAMREEYKNLT